MLALLRAAGFRLYHDGRYEGGFVADRREGRGEYRFTDQSEYRGFWKADQRHGLGLQTSGAETVSYEGEWKEDKRDGLGIDVAAGWVGQWKADALVAELPVPRSRLPEGACLGQHSQRPC